MEIVKFGLIGLMVLLPFIFLGSVEAEKAYYEDVTKDYLELQLEEALFDAAFAMKTYSQASYHGDQVYRIDIPYDQVVEVFFSSLDYRDFNYSRKDFPVILFVGYKSLRGYLPDKDSFTPEIPYYDADVGGPRYFDLSDLGDESLSQAERNKYQVCLTGQMEAVVNQLLWQGRNSQQVSLSLPVYEDGGSMVLNDLSIAVIYQGSCYSGLGFTSYMDVKPAGVMKMQEIIAY